MTARAKSSRDGAQAATIKQIPVITEGHAPHADFFSPLPDKWWTSRRERIIPMNGAPAMRDLIPSPAL